MPLLKPRTREGYEHLLRRYVDPAFGDLQVPDLTPAVVRRWWAGLSAEHPTVNARAYALLRAILGTAVTAELIPTNPCRVRAASNPPTKKDVRPATPAELEILVSEMPDARQAVFLVRLVCAAHRRGARAPAARPGLGSRGRVRDEGGVVDWRAARGGHSEVCGGDSPGRG
ncbi:MAG: hypothetical protein WBG36_09840 [Ornithinimicrobium sp.]